MRRDDDKIRVQLDSTVGDFKCVSSVLEKWLESSGPHSPELIRTRVKNFNTMLLQQIMKG